MASTAFTGSEPSHSIRSSLLSGMTTSEVCLALRVHKNERVAKKEAGPAQSYGKQIRNLPGSPSDRLPRLQKVDQVFDGLVVAFLQEIHRRPPLAGIVRAGQPGPDD